MGPKARETYSRCLVEAFRGLLPEVQDLVEHYWSLRHEKLHQ